MYLPDTGWEFGKLDVEALSRMTLAMKYAATPERHVSETRAARKTNSMRLTFDEWQDDKNKQQTLSLKLILPRSRKAILDENQRKEWH